MKIELTIDKEGDPVFKLRHLDRCSTLEEKLLGIFLERAMKNGIVINSIGGMVEAGTDNSHEDYKISALKG